MINYPSRCLFVYRGLLVLFFLLFVVCLFTFSESGEIAQPIEYWPASLRTHDAVFSTHKKLGGTAGNMEMEVLGLASMLVCLSWRAPCSVRLCFTK